MGYTHYWTTRRGADLHPRELFEDIGRLADASGLPLEREISRKRFLLNGVGDDGHEAFTWPPDHSDPQPWYSHADRELRHFEFCKTARKPYDRVVTACLIAVKQRLGRDVIVASDGNLPWDWAAGLALYNETFPDRAMESVAAMVAITTDRLRKGFEEGVTR